MSENNKPIGFDFADMTEIDNAILAEMNKPGLVDHMQEDSEKREQQKMSWTDEFSKDPGLYFFLAISAVFTALLGIMLGLAPVKQFTAEGVPYIRFNTDWVHIVIMLLLVTGFVGVTEVAFAVGKRKYHTREEASPKQKYTSWFMMAIAFVSIIVTGTTGGIITASVLGFLSDFSKIPHGAQVWAAIGIPFLIAIYAVLLTVYNLSSEAAKTERITRDRKRKLDLENKTRMDNIRALAGVKLQYTEIQLFWQKVNEGLLTAAEANAAIMAGETLMQTEKRLGRDLNGDGKLGENKALPGTSRPALPAAQRHYTTQELCDLWKMTRQQAAATVASYNNFNHMFSYGKDRAGFIPQDMTRENFLEIYNDLMSEAEPVRIPEPVERKNGVNP